MFRRFAPTGGRRARSRVVITLALAMIGSGLASSPAWAAAPTNDQFADAEFVSGSLPITVPGTNVEATKESGEPEHAGNPGGGSVWYTWTPTKSGNVTIHTCDSDFDTLLAVYVGDTVETLAVQAENDDACGAAQSSVSFAAVSGTPYRIAVDGFEAAQGTFTLTVARTIRGNKGPHQETVHIDETYIDFNTGFFCGFPVQAHDVGTVRTGVFPMDRFVEAFNQTTTYTNLDTGFSVEVRSSAHLTDTSIDNLDPNFTGTFTERSRFTGLNYRLIGNGEAVSAGEGLVTVTYTFLDGRITAIDVDETTSPHLEHITAIICQALSGAAIGKASISGTVRDDTTGAALDSMCVSAYDTNGRLTSTTLSQNDGSYRLRFLTAGQYALRFDDCNTGAYLTEWYRDQPAFATATFVSVKKTGEVRNVDARLTAGGVITGRVTNEAGEPIHDIIAAAYDPNNLDFVRDTETDSSGNYRIIGLPAGQYEINFYDPFVDIRIYTQQWYDHVSRRADATLVPATPGTVTTGIDATLAVGGSVSGTVTDSAGQPRDDACVSIIGTGEEQFAAASTDSDGRYHTAGLEAGTYVVEFYDCIGPYTLVTEFYNDKPTFTSAERITVTLGNDTPGIDAVLAIGGGITGHVTIPSGAPAEAACVIAVPLIPGEFASYLESTDADGNYRIGSLPPGDYKVEFSGCVLNGPRYITEWWNNQPDEASADIVHVTAGVDVNIDAQLALP